jgi:NTE family protein
MPDGLHKPWSPRNVSLVLAGGVALGAYEAGAYAGLHDYPELGPGWLAGSSIGAVNAAIIAGNPPCPIHES